MPWCAYCAKDQIAEQDDINGFTCCTGCGRVLDDNVYSTAVTFTKGADGMSQAEGNFLRDGQSSLLRIGGGQGRVLGFQSNSHEKTLTKGKHEIQEIADRLNVRPREDLVQAAHRFYTIALERNFTRGRPTQRVAGACLYIVCRQENKPFMLIDFSDCLQTNVYVLGAVFLQLCQLLRLEQHPVMQKPVDPSLFIHRFADRLDFGNKMHTVANSALRLVASMKRDWMQTGRRPSGICGAALFIAAHIHGFERSKADVVSVVHICEATLKKRLVEFEHTESGSLTTEEFNAKAKEIDLQIRIGLVSPQLEGKGTMETICEHKDMGEAHYAHGLCRKCYNDFVEVSGGMQGGSAPPAFQRAEKKRLEEESKEKEKEKGLVLWEGEDNPTSGKLTIKGRGRGQGRGRGRDFRGKGKRKRKWVDGCEINIESDAEDAVEEPAEKWKGSGKGRGWGRGRGRGRGRNQPQVEESEEDSDMDVPLASALPLSSKSPHKLLTNKPVEDPVVIPAVKTDVTLTVKKDSKEFVSEGPMERVREDGNTVALEVSVPVPVLEKRQLEISCVDPICAPEENCVNGDTVGEAVIQREGDEKQVLRAARDDDWLDNDADTLSDIDDDELKAYLHNDEEVRLKTIIWTEMNKEYLEEQAAKQAAIAATEAARMAAFEAAATNSASAAELAAAAAAAVAKLKKDRKQKRADDAKKPPAQNAADATRQMLESKKLSSKVNYAVLADLFNAEESGKLSAIEEGTEEDMNGNSGPIRPVKRKGKVTFADDAQVASATGKTEDDDGKDDEPKLEEEGDIDEDAGEDEEEVYGDVHNYNDVELPTFGAAEEEDYYEEY